MTDKNHQNALAAFYQERFNSRPEDLADYCYNDITSIAAEVFLDWPAISNGVRFTVNAERSKVGGKIVATEKKHNGKLMAWADLRDITLDDGTKIRLPFLTFNHNNHSIGSSNWSGWQALLDLYRLQGGKVPSAEQMKWREAQETRAVERARRQEAAEQEERETHARKIAERDAFELAWFKGGLHEYPVLQRGKVETVAVEVLADEDGTAPYLQAKQISDIAQVYRMQRMRDWLGEFTALPLFDIHGQFGGVQRLYADKKLQGTGVQMDGLHIVLGDLESADRIYSAEGFATGASIYLAEQSVGKSVAVIITLSVGNLIKVLALYKRHRPELKIINAADNDQWKKTGNAGRLAALDLHRDHGYRAVLPAFEDMTEDDVREARRTGKGPTDWNDYHCRYGLKATSVGLRSREVLKADSDYFVYCLQRVEAGSTTDEAAALTAVGAGMMQAPIKYGTKQVISLVLKALPAAFSGNVFKIKRRALWLAKIKLSEAQQLRGFSPTALARPGIRHIKIKGIRASHGGTIIPSHVADLVESLEGCIIVRSPMGSGKTDNLIGPVMRNSKRAGYLAHRITLMDDAANRLQIRHYSDVLAVEMRDVTHMACCVNSITNSRFYSTATDRNWFTTLETLCIDEASQVIRHVTSGPVEGPVRVMDTMLEAMAKSKRVLLCDADANDSVISLCEEACPGTPITIIEVEGSMDHVAVRFGDADEVWQKALELIHGGKRVLVASDSAESAKRLAVLALEKNPELRLLLIFRDSKSDPAVEAFLANPSEEAINYDVLIYSPAISSGVSMTRPHFEHHIGLFSGNTVGPSDAVQMLRRDRTARSYLIGIGHSNVQRDTDREAIYRGLVAADEIACSFEETTAEILLRRKKTAFDELYLSCVTNENRAKNNFANNLLLMLYGDGYKVSRMDGDALLAKLSRTNRKRAGELVFAQRLELIDSVTTPTDEEFARLNRMEIRSEAESARVDRYQIEHQLGVETIRADDVAFYDDGGISKVVALELLQATEAQALAFDKAQRKSKVTLTKTRFKTPARAFLHDVFTTLGVDPMTGVGDFNSAACRQVLAKIMATQASAEMYNALRLGKLVKFGAKRCCATTVVQSILRRLGLDVSKRKSKGASVYCINPEHWAFITGYVKNRAVVGVHSLATHEHPCPHEPRLAVENANSAVILDSRDTLQSIDIAPDEKYPSLQIRERIYAAARSAFDPLGNSLSRLIEALTPEVAKGFASSGADNTMIRFILQHADRALDSVGGA
jgi:hypothetical protein